MKYFPLIFLVACAASLPPMPPGAKTVLKSPKDAASFVGKVSAPAVIVAPKQLKLMWNYPSNELATVTFEVWHKTNLAQPFTLLTNVDGPPMAVQMLPQEFFIVRPKSRATGQLGPWNVK